MGKGASFALGPPRPPPHGRGGLFRFGTTEAPTAWARGFLRFGTTEAIAIATARGTTISGTQNPSYNPLYDLPQQTTIAARLNGYGNQTSYPNHNV